MVPTDPTGWRPRRASVRAGTSPGSTAGTVPDVSGEAPQAVHQQPLNVTTPLPGAANRSLESHTPAGARLAPAPGSRLITTARPKTLTLSTPGIWVLLGVFGAFRSSTARSTGAAIGGGTDEPRMRPQQALPQQTGFSTTPPSSPSVIAFMASNLVRTGFRRWPEY